MIMARLIVNFRSSIFLHHCVEGHKISAMLLMMLRTALILSACLCIRVTWPN